MAKQSGKKVKAGKAAALEHPEAATNVVDFMALLKRSLEKKGEKAPATRKRATAKRKKTASG